MGGFEEMVQVHPPVERKSLRVPYQINSDAVLPRFLIRIAPSPAISKVLFNDYKEHCRRPVAKKILYLTKK